MDYPKEIMKLSELVAMGYTREMMYQVCHAKGTPAFKVGKGKNAHWYVRTNKLDEFIDKLHRMAN